jgi:hypothetical protein
VKPSTLRDRMDKQGITGAAALLAGLLRVLPDDWSIRVMQRHDISQVLALTGGRIEGPGGAAALLGVKPSTLRTNRDAEGSTPVANTWRQTDRHMRPGSRKRPTDR